LFYFSIQYNKFYCPTDVGHLTDKIFIEKGVICLKISFRLNKEYDKLLINELEKYKDNNRSHLIRKILNEYFLKLKEKQNNHEKQNQPIKWNFPPS
jgi:hypothetical protein